MKEFFELDTDYTTPYNPVVTLLAPAVAALVVHAAVQVREPYAHHAVVGMAAVWAALMRWLMNSWELDVFHAALTTAAMFAVFCATLAISMSIYRVFFHPLRHFPGPLSCKLSMWSWLWCDWAGYRATYTQSLHAKYGPVVRTGPRVLSIADPRALSIIYGPSGPAAATRRGPWYSMQSRIPGVNSLQAEPVIAEHNKRRREWDPAFSVRALTTYEPNIARNTETLISQITRHANAHPDNIVDVRTLMMWFGFDVMGELAFARSFGTLKDGKTSKEVHLIEIGVRVLAAAANVPYMNTIIRYLPSPIQAFESWLEDAVQWRRSKQGDRDYVQTDVSAYLLGEEGTSKVKRDPRTLLQDCMLLVVAGSDTTSNTLAFCIFELAQQQNLIKRLRAEVEHIAADNFAGLRDNAPLLNACLNETLRLWPAVPSGLTRQVTLPHVLPGNVHIPARTVVSTHTWTMHRDPANFHDPTSYIPDRWIDKSQPFNEKAFSPFGFGATSCIGKNLAYMEMRLVLAQFVMAFDFTITQADATSFKASIRDQFVASAEQLNMRITPRA